jgi:hypothetical protein
LIATPSGSSAVAMLLDDAHKIVVRLALVQQHGQLQLDGDAQLRLEPRLLVLARRRHTLLGRLRQRQRLLRRRSLLLAVAWRGGIVILRLDGGSVGGGGGGSSGGGHGRRLFVARATLDQRVVETNFTDCADARLGEELSNGGDVVGGGRERARHARMNADGNKQTVGVGACNFERASGRLGVDRDQHRLLDTGGERTTHIGAEVGGERLSIEIDTGVDERRQRRQRTKRLWLSKVARRLGKGDTQLDSGTILKDRTRKLERQDDAIILSERNKLLASAGVAHHTLDLEHIANDAADAGKVLRGVRAHNEQNLCGRQRRAIGDRALERLLATSGGLIGDLPAQLESFGRHTVLVFLV